MADVAHQGQSGVINENKLGNDRESLAVWMMYGLKLTVHSKLV